MEIPASTKEFILRHREEDVRILALKGTRDGDIDLTLALTQIEGWQKAQGKIPTWSRTQDIIYPAHLPMEQCSSELTALYKKEVMASSGTEHLTFADLTGGLGIDCSFVAPLYNKVEYVERQETLCQLAKHNFRVLGLKQINVHHQDATGFLESMEPVDWIFIDPARRDKGGNKVAALADCEPNLLEIKHLLLRKARHTMVKLSPMLDITQAVEQLGNVASVHVVSVDNECKELLLIMSEQAEAKIPITCVNLFTGEMERQTFCFSREEEQSLSGTFAFPKSYLYEPNASLMKAGAFKSLGKHFGLDQLHPSSHLYTSDKDIDNFPGRAFLIEGASTFGKKELKNLLAGVEKANLATRNFPIGVNELRKKLKLREGGDIYLFATTLNGGERVLLKCKANKKAGI